MAELYKEIPSDEIGDSYSVLKSTLHIGDSGAPGDSYPVAAIEAVIDNDGGDSVKAYAILVRGGKIKLGDTLSSFEFSDETVQTTKGMSIEQGDSLYANPAGIVQSFGGDTAPSGYLLCDGSAISRTTYSTLFSTISTAFGNGDSTTTFNIPDLRGYFLRGRDAGEGIDPDAATRTALQTGGDTGDNVGSKQLDQFQGHGHHSWQATSTGTTTARHGSSGSNYYSSTHVRYPITYGSYGTVRTGTETRPINVYVNYIIKY